MSGASRWLEWFATTTKARGTSRSLRRPTTVTLTTDQVTGFRMPRCATKRATAWAWEVKRSLRGVWSASIVTMQPRSEERRVGKECRSRRAALHGDKKEKNTAKKEGNSQR